MAAAAFWLFVALVTALVAWSIAAASLTATDAPERSLRVVAHQRVSLLRIRNGEEVPCETLERCLAVSRYLLEQAPDWLG